MPEATVSCNPSCIIAIYNGDLIESYSSASTPVASNEEVGKYIMFREEDFHTVCLCIGD